MKSFEYGVAIEGWEFHHQIEVTMWLRETFGPGPDKWTIMHDYGLESIEMDEDVYTAYLLRWS